MRIGRWVLGSGPEHAGLLMGNDAAGKTTMLYQLKLGEQVTAIPTIGFNVETIEYADGGKITLWDVGGCDRIRPLIRHYIDKNRFIIFIHDCTDNDRLDYSLEQFNAGVQWLAEAGGRYVWVLFNKQDLLRPSERDTIVNDLRSKFEMEAQRYQANVSIKIMDTPGLSAASGSQLDLAMNEIRQTLKQIPKPIQKSSQAQIAEAEKGPSEQELIEKIQKANSESVRADDFWDSFLRGDLDSWDHYSHLRAGYLVLFEGLSRRSSLLDCTTIFLSYLDELRGNNPERFRNTSHKTMTAFWLYHIQLAAVAYKVHKGLQEFPSKEDFGEILLLTPSLMNSGLWRSYYSKDLLFSPEARENWHLPDLQPLPSFRKQASSSAPNSQMGDDDAYRLPRFAFAVVQRSLTSKLRRGGVVKQALETLQTSTIRLRASNQSISPYSETQAYFWVQLIHALLKSLEINPNNAQTAPSGFDVPGTVLTFEAFRTLFDLSGNEWKEYYSQKAWESVPARMSFVNPDRKPLPNVFASPSPAKKRLARLRMLNAASDRFIAPPELPSQEELEFAAAVLIDEANLEGTLNVASHASLLQYLYRRLSTSAEEATQSEDNRPSGSAAAKVAMDLSEMLGSTQGVFWVQQAQISLAKTNGPMTFEEFITQTPHLAYEDLPLLYYSPERWWSTEAKEVFMPPDRRSLSSIVSKTGFN